MRAASLVLGLLGALAGAAGNHPVNVSHLEEEYLKGLHLRRL